MSQQGTYIVLQRQKAFILIRGQNEASLSNILLLHWLHCMLIWLNQPLTQKMTTSLCYYLFAPVLYMLSYSLKRIIHISQTLHLESTSLSYKNCQQNIIPGVDRPGQAPMDTVIVALHPFVTPVSSRVTIRSH